MNIATNGQLIAVAAFTPWANMSLLSCEPTLSSSLHEFLLVLPQELLNEMHISLRTVCQKPDISKARKLVRLDMGTHLFRITR